MKLSIKNHADGIINFRASVDEMRRRLARQESELQNQERLLAFSEHQLAEALRRGLDGYDEDKFCKPRKKPTTPQKEAK